MDLMILLVMVQNILLAIQIALVAVYLKKGDR
jgi:hypothetical protein